VLFPIKKTVNMWGFTLIEMLVAISIIIILTLITVPIYQGSRKELALQRATGKLAQDLRSAQEMAMAAREITGSVRPRYGVEFDTGSPDSYVLFADDNNNGTRQPSDLVIETIVLEKGVTINQLSVGDPPVSRTKIWITFSPPDPTTEIRGPAITSIGRIQIIGGDKTKTIAVNNAGLIFIE